MSFRRRFVYLVVGACHSRRAVLDVCHTPAATFRLHRVNMSRFFYPQPPAAMPPPPPDASAMVDARLPRHTMSFYAPSSSSEEEHYDGRMQFMLLGRDRVLATDQTGRAAIYDAAAHATRTAPAFTRPKNDPVSVAVGDDALYVLDTSARPEEPCFEALVYDRGGLRTGTWRTDYYDDWRCHPLPPRPFPGAYLDAVGAYTVVGGSDIWMSTKDGCTYSFDTARRAWAKQGDWTLPFQGLAEFVPEYNLWFGLSSTKNNHLCALDLAGAAKRQSSSPPAPRNVWEDLKPPKDWRPERSYLVHLGSGRFCVARFFDKIDSDMDVRSTTVKAVFTGVEVKPCGKAGRGLQMIKHKSECYSLEEPFHWVL
uniref:F-box associated domain-containing protein n=1 Tax=Oryza glumipatula TaxID=40148 RepID=A0A0D9YM32_9ORYZ